MTSQTICVICLDLPVARLPTVKGRFQKVPNGEGTRVPTAQVKPCIIYRSPCPSCCCYSLFFHCESCFFYKGEVGLRFQPRFFKSFLFSCYLQISAVWLKLIILVSLCARPRPRRARLPRILSGNRLVGHFLLKCVANSTKSRESPKFSSRTFSVFGGIFNCVTLVYIVNPSSTFSCFSSLGL